MNIAISLVLVFTLTISARLVFDCRLPGLLVVGLYVAIYWVLSQLRQRSKPNPHADEPDPDYSDWPTSGPIGRFGQAGLLTVWSVSSLFAALNPFQLVQIVRQAVGNVRLERREQQGGGEWTQVQYRPPFDGEWLLYNGGMTPKTSHSWDVLGQRYALLQSRHRHIGLPALIDHALAGPVTHP